ncbi:MAG TPA: hypothetical protein DIW61_06205 [Candidatus Aminicenantes bacterium]|nr:hypothetical protein [Candidatus Aminicenantes bacterium]
MNDEKKACFRSADDRGLDDEVFLILSGSAEVILGGEVSDKKSTADHSPLSISERDEISSADRLETPLLLE